MRKCKLQMQLQMLIAATVKDMITTATQTGTGTGTGTQDTLKPNPKTVHHNNDGRWSLSLSLSLALPRSPSYSLCKEATLTHARYIDRGCFIHMQILWSPQMKCQHAEMQREHRIANYGMARWGEMGRNVEGGTRQSLV